VSGLMNYFRSLSGVAPGSGPCSTELSPKFDPKPTA